MINFNFVIKNISNSEIYVARSTNNYYRLQGIGRQCPMYVDGTKNELTGRQVVDEQTIQYILKLHNEIRSKIAKGRCDQPIAGCMKPLVRCLRLDQKLIRALFFKTL